MCFDRTEKPNSFHSCAKTEVHVPGTPISECCRKIRGDRLYRAVPQILSYNTGNLPKIKGVGRGVMGGVKYSYIFV